MSVFEIRVRSRKHSDMIPITESVLQLIPVDFTGACLLFSTHTTAGLTVNENADPDVQEDILGALDRIVPWEHPSYRHAEGNSAAHVKASMMGFDLNLPVCDGEFEFGCWQDIYLCEFDGPRERVIKMILLPAYQEPARKNVPLDGE